MRTFNIEITLHNNRGLKVSFDDLFKLENLKYQIQNNSKHVRMRNAKYWVPQGQENEQFPSQGKRIHCSLIYFLSKLSIIRL